MPSRINRVSRVFMCVDLMQYDVDSAYENSTFCNKIKIEEEMRHRRASSSLGCSRLYDGTRVHSLTHTQIKTVNVNSTCNFFR